MTSESKRFDNTDSSDITTRIKKRQERWPPPQQHTEHQQPLGTQTQSREKIDKTELRMSEINSESEGYDASAEDDVYSDSNMDYFGRRPKTSIMEVLSSEQTSPEKENFSSSHRRSSSFSTIRGDSVNPSSPERPMGLSENVGDNSVNQGSPLREILSAPATPLALLPEKYVATMIEASQQDGIPSSTSLLPSTSSKSTTNIPATATKKAPANSMTVETETVSAVPTVAVTTVGNNSSSGGVMNNNSSTSLKIKKSIDNVTINTNRPMKKKSSRLAAVSKAEIFAAKIASAVDEVDSSDSDETFVYESNPTNQAGSSSQTSAPGGSSGSTSSNNAHRPRLQKRNPSTSSIPLSGSAQNDGTRKSITKQQDMSGMASDSSVGATVTATAPETRELLGVPNSSRDGTGSRYSSQYLRHTISRPTSPKRVSGGGSGYVSPKVASVRSNTAGPHFLRNSNSRLFYDQGHHYRHTHNHGMGHNGTNRGNSIKKHLQRWRGGYDEEEGFEDDDGEFNDDDDDYVEYTETTPLRQAGHSIRRTKKNSGLVVYSPHNYQRRSDSQLYFCRRVLWVSLGIICMLGAGFIMGFLLATSKPLHEVKLTNIFNVIMSEEVLEFDVVIEAINPGVLAISAYDVDLDIFAKSPYVRDNPKKQGYEDNLQIMLLGNIRHFKAPLVFEGGFLNRVVQKSVGDVRLTNPGKNFTLDQNDNSNNTVRYNDIYADPIAIDDKKKGDKKLDDGQLRWIRVSSHPFDLTVRGVSEIRLDIWHETSCKHFQGECNI